jgi:hypothetical protein
MNDAPAMEKLALELRRIACSGTSDLEAAVGCYLACELAGLEPHERLRSLKTLSDRLDGNASPATAVVGAADQDLTRLVLHFLGRSVDTGKISSAEILEKFAGSLEILFNSLNEIVSSINVTLLGQHPELETIRKVIGSNMESGADTLSIKEYLDRIQHAFLAAHSSFQVAATTLIAELLAELDPAELSKAKSSGLKFGPLRRAELFEMYEEKYARCKRWFDSGQFKESLLREFEKNCRQTFTGK